MNPRNRIEPRSPANTGQRQAAFTITELLVVMSLIAILMSTVLPATTVMHDMVAGKTATNTAAVAVTTAQAYAMVAKADLQDSGDPDHAGFTYSGTAVLFTPAGELRLVENDQSAAEDEDDPTTLLKLVGRNGYQDIPERNYIKLPRDMGVVGIARGDTGDADLFTPPFAVRFNAQGNLIAGPEVDYDGNNYDEKYEATGRPGNYDPDGWDPTVTPIGPDDMHNGLYKLPFEQIETVVGVVVYSKSDLREADLTHIGNLTTRHALNTNARDWILDNGEVILFNRLTGTMIRRPKS